MCGHVVAAPDVVYKTRLHDAIKKVHELPREEGIKYIQPFIREGKFNIVKSVFIELIRGCDYFGCSSPCPANNKKKQTMDNNSIKHILTTYSKWYSNSNNKKIVLYGYGDVSDFDFISLDNMIKDLNLGMFIPLNIQTIITHNYDRFCDEKYSRLGIDFYFRVNSLEDIDEILKLPYPMIKENVLIIADKEIPLLEMLERLISRGCCVKIRNRDNCGVKKNDTRAV